MARLKQGSIRRDCCHCYCYCCCHGLVIVTLTLNVIFSFLVARCFFLLARHKAVIKITLDIVFDMIIIIVIFAVVVVVADIVIMIILVSGRPLLLPDGASQGSDRRL